MWNRRDYQIELTLIRHGRTPGNMQQRYIGRTDEALSEEGKQHLLERKAAGDYPVTDMVAASPMRRCAQTAELLYPKAAPLWVADFREMDFGVFEGKNYRQLHGDARYQQWIDSNGTLPFPDGESREEFIKRCRSGFVFLLRQLAGVYKEGLRAAAVVHGGTIMALLDMYGQGSYFEYACENGGGYHCTVHCTATEKERLVPEDIFMTDIRRF